MKSDRLHFVTYIVLTVILFVLIVLLVNWLGAPSAEPVTIVD